MEYKYYDGKGNKVEHSNVIEAAKDFSVYKIVTTNEIGKQEYFRSGAGWIPAK